MHVERTQHLAGSGPQASLSKSITQPSSAPTPRSCPGLTPHHDRQTPSSQGPSSPNHQQVTVTIVPTSGTSAPTPSVLPRDLVPASRLEDTAVQAPNLGRCISSFPAAVCLPPALWGPPLPAHASLRSPPHFGEIDTGISSDPARALNRTVMG